MSITVIVAQQQSTTISVAQELPTVIEIETGPVQLNLDIDETSSVDVVSVKEIPSYG